SGLRVPKEGVVDAEGVGENTAQEGTHPGEGLRMRRPRRASAYHVGGDGKIQARDTIFKEPDSLQTEQACDNCGNRREQERPGSLRIFLVELLGLVDPY